MEDVEDAKVNGVGEVKKRSASAIDFCFFYFYFIGRRRTSSMIAEDTEDIKDNEDIEDIEDIEDAHRQWSRGRSKNALRARQGNFYFLIFIKDRHIAFWGGCASKNSEKFSNASTRVRVSVRYILPGRKKQ